MAIITLEEAKTLLQITDSSKDALIDLQIPIVEEFIQTYCGNKFVDGFPAGLKIWAVKMIGYNINNLAKSGIQSETISRYSVTYGSSGDATSGYPVEIMNGLNQYRKLKWGKSDVD